MRYEVKKGIIKRKGSFLRKGSFFDAAAGEVKDLLAAGVVAAVSEPEEQIDTKDELPEGLKDLGKGNFELSDGRKIKGKAKAVEAQLTLNAASDLDPDDQGPDNGDDDMPPPNFDANDTIVDQEAGQDGN